MFNIFLFLENGRTNWFGYICIYNGVKSHQVKSVVLKSLIYIKNK